MGLEPKEEAALRKLVTYLSPADEDADVLEKVDALIDEWHAREQRLADLEGKMTRAPDKDGKIDAILEHAHNSRTDQDVVKLGPKDIKAATGVSRRYAYDLLDDLPDEKDWILSHDTIKRSQFASHELDNDSKRIGIDFEGVHSNGAPVNRFTTTSRNNPRSETATEEER